MANNKKMKVKTRLQVNAAIITAAAILCVILLNVVAYELNFKKAFYYDTTETKTYQFSQETKYFFDHMKKDVTLYALFPNDGRSDSMKKSIEQFPNVSKKVKLKYVDIYRNPEFARKYSKGGEGVKDYSVIVDSGDKYKIVTADEMYKFDKDGNQSLNVESTIINAIVYVTGGSNPVRVYFTTGQGEHSYEELSQALAKDNYYVSTVNVATSGVPEDADMIICAAPTIDFTPQAIDSLDKYFDNGGNGAFLFSPGLKALPKLDNYLEEWGIKVNRDLVFEGDASRNKSESAFKSEPIPYIQADDNDINSALIENGTDFVAPNSSSLTLSDNNQASAKVTALLKTSTKAYTKKNITADMSTAKESGDATGQFTLAAMSKRFTPDNNDISNIFVSGTYDAFEGNGYISEPGYANGDFFLNITSFFTGRSNNSITSIRPKDATTGKLSMTAAQVNFCKIVLQWVIPCIIFAAGLIVWIRRRYL
ncbi:MAG: Gldg family protein [Bacillota bacterium]|nr:Gldg family protein [Bacillota bacterium]